MGKQVPASDDWIHELKHDGCRLIVRRDGKRVRLFTRNGHDWTARYPLIVEAALRNRISSFVVDGRCCSASTASHVGHPDHVKAFADPEAAERCLRRTMPKG